MSHLLLYNKPHGNVSGCTLAIVGALPDYGKDQAYQGRLPVFGARGSVTLTSWTGTLPPGAQVAYDNGAQQIVVTWPAYSPGTNADVPNLDFQSGDVGFADGAGIDIRSIPGQTPVDPAVPDNTWYMHYQNVGGESAAMSQAYIPAVPGKTYTASVDLWRASTRKHADGGAVRIIFYDANKKHISGNDGNVVKEQTDRQWHTSSVSMAAPANAAFVDLGVSFFRIHDNDEVLAANLQWNGAFVDGTQAQGTDGAVPYSVTFSVRDSMGCRATWQGAITVEPGQAFSISFDDDLVTDSTGHAWDLTTKALPGTGMPTVTVPFLDSTLALSGQCMSLCPDSDNATAGLRDYSPSFVSGASTQGIRSTLGAYSPGKTEDFCLEMSLRVNQYLSGGGEAYGFCKVGVLRGAFSDTSPPQMYVFDISGGIFTTMESSTPPVTAGDYFHFALTREGDVVTLWKDGNPYARYSGGSNWDVNSDTIVYLGNVQGTLASGFGWFGQIDNVRFTVGWARYTAPFTPPL